MHILKEVHNFCPQVKVVYANALAKGGVVIHTTCEKDREVLERELP